MSELHHWSISELQRGLHSREVSATDITEHFLERITRLNPELGALVYLDMEGARERAREVDRLIAEGHPVTPGMGLPTADKDLVRRQGMPTSFGSRTRAGANPESESDPMALWLDAVGAISVGKSATSEFGLSGYTEPVTGPLTRNPHDRERSAGGSSGGAAVAVAAGMVPFAPGSDGGGSIRIPALACGVAGWKPSRGIVPAGSGFDHIGHLAVPGVIARTLSDIEHLAPQLLEGSMPWATVAPVTPQRPITKVGVTRGHPWPRDWGVTEGAEATTALEVAIEALSDEGVAVEWFEWEPATDYAENFFTLWAVSAAAIDVPEEEEDQLEGLTRFLRQRGREVSGVELSRALSRLKSFERETITRFAPFDAVLTPGLGFPAPKLGWFDREDPELNFRQQVLFTPWTSFVNVSGLPAVSLPTAVTDEGLPMGVQLIGRPGDDLALISRGATLQQRLSGATRWPRSAG